MVLLEMPLNSIYFPLQHRLGEAMTWSSKEAYNIPSEHALEGSACLCHIHEARL